MAAVRDVVLFVIVLLSVSVGGYLMLEEREAAYVAESSRG